MTEIRLLIVEDDDFTRTTLVSALRLYGIDVIADAKTVRSAAKMAKTLMPNAALIDLNLGEGPNGVDLALHLRTLNPEIGIVILTSFEDPRLLQRNLPELPGNTQWMVKRTISDVLQLAQALEKSIAAPTHPSQSTKYPKMQDLTPVQVETLRLVGAGFTNAEIARKRFVSERSVEQTISKLSKSFGLTGQPTYNQRATLVKVFYRYANDK